MAPITWRPSEQLEIGQQTVCLLSDIIIFVCMLLLLLIIMIIILLS